jgi:hypothetical protein
MKPLVVILALMLPTVCHAAADVPSFASGTAYAKARTSLRSLGWLPAPQASRRCPDLRRDMCNDRQPEVVSCAASAGGACSARWRRGRLMIEVRTVGEQPATVARVCRSKCR